MLNEVPMLRILSQRKRIRQPGLQAASYPSGIANDVQPDNLLLTVKASEILAPGNCFSVHQLRADRQIDARARRFLPGGGCRSTLMVVLLSDSASWIALVSFIPDMIGHKLASML